MYCQSDKLYVLILTRAGQNNTIVDLLLAVQNLHASQLLPLKRGKRSLLHDLARSNLVVISDYCNFERIKPLLDAVLNE